MRRLWIAPFLIIACGPSTKRPPPIKKPNDELIIGDFARRGADGETAIRFNGDGGYRLGKNKSLLDKDPILGKGSWKLDKDRLTLTAQVGACAEAAGEKQATYKVVISKIGIRFAKVEDGCPRRATMDGQTWWRVK